MTDFARLVLASDTTGLRTARAELNHLTRTGANTEGRVNRSMAAMGAGFKSVALQAAGMVAAFAGIGAAMRSSQEIVGITNGLRAMGMSTQEAEQALDDIADVAMRTRAPLKETAELYRRVSVAGKDLGASQSDVLRFTENVGLALAASGTGANEASGALLQLSQAMAGGVVRAEEFNSILEGAFPIAQAAADGIDAAGGSVGRLRVLVTEGKVSSEEFFRAIISQTDALEDAFGNTVPTIAQAMTVLASSIGLAAFGFDSALGASEMLASGILALADGVTVAASAIGSAKQAVDDFLSGLLVFGGEVDSVRVVLSGTAVVLTGMYLPAVVSATVATASWVASLVTLRGALLATGIGALIVGAGMLVDFLIRLRTATGSWGAALEALGDLAAGVWEGIKTSASSIAPALGSVWATIHAGFLSMVQSIQGIWADFLHNVVGALREVPGMNEAALSLHGAAVMAGSAVNSTGASVDALREKSAALRQEAASLASSGLDKVREASARLSEVLATETEASDEATRSAQDLSSALDDIGSEAGGGSAGRAADGIKKVKDATEEARKAQERWADTMAGHFDGLITGGKDFGDVLMSIARQLEGRMWKQLFGGTVDGGGIGGFFSKIGTSLGKSIGRLFSFDGGGYTGSGSRSGGVDGRGGFPAILHPNETVIDHTKGQGFGGGGGTLTVVVDVRSSEDLIATAQQAGAEAGAQAGPGAVALQITSGRGAAHSALKQAGYVRKQGAF